MNFHKFTKGYNYCIFFIQPIFIQNIDHKFFLYKIIIDPFYLYLYDEKIGCERENSVRETFKKRGDLCWRR